ncbi:unnamed protein product [Cochlearia groenlandica]
MLMESSFSSSVESSLLKVSKYRDQFAAYDWASLAESYGMIQKIPRQSQEITLEAVPVPVAMDLDESKHPKIQVSCPKQSAMHKVSKESLTSLVYSRRKGIVRPVGTAEHNSQNNKKHDVSLDDSIVPIHNPGESTEKKNRFHNCLVYRRKRRRDGLDNAFVSGNEFGETSKTRGIRFDNYLVYRRKKGRVKFNSCSSSQLVSGGTYISGAQTDSNGSFTKRHIGETKINGARSDGLLVYSRRKQREKPIGARVNGFLTDTDSCMSPFRQCKHCDKPGTGEKMLICDECEEAYHSSCCGVRMKEVPDIDDWLCPSCLKNKSSKTKIKGRTSRQRKWRVTETFVTKIRIGKEFQADVPEWSGPTMSDIYFAGEPLEIDQSEYLHDFKEAKNGKKRRFAVSWLQCREEDTNGDICGKWRRAPRTEVQTKDWECSCCVFWDPLHADCAVPQELETSEILKQLKYIKMLRPRSDAKTRKLGPESRNRSHNKGKSS